MSAAGRAVVVSPSVRLQIDSEQRSSVVIHLESRRTAALSAAEVLLLVGALEPVEVDQLIDKVAEATGEDQFIVLQRLQALLDVGFIDFVGHAQPVESAGRSARLAWSQAGWAADYDYLVSTRDMPFHGGDREGLAEAASVMRGYASQAPDEQRCKRFEHAALRRPLPALSDLMARAGEVGAWPLQQRLLALASCAVAPVRASSPPWGGAALFRKLHPSGGARHPTEAYLSVTEALDGLPAGHFHLQVDPLELVPLQPTLIQLPLGLLEPASTRVPFKITAALTLTTCFGRNRYRYRESRTYRTVHMDVGHILTNVEELAATLRLAVFVAYTWDSESAELLTGYGGLEEGVLATVFLGDSPCN